MNRCKPERKEYLTGKLLDKNIMVFILIGIFILLYAFIDFRKSFLVYLVFKALLNGNITVIAVPELPTLTLDLMMIIFYAVFFYCKGGKYKRAKMPFDFTIPFSFLVISWFFSGIFAVIGFSSVLTRTISTILNEVIIIYIMWEVVEDEKDFKFLFKWFTIVFFASCIYGMVEYVIQSNPLLAYEQTIIQDSSRIRDFSYDASSGRGYRVSSFFEHAIGAAINWGMYIVWILVSVIQYKWNVKPRYTALLTVVLCIPCIFMGKSRSALLFVVVGCLAFVNFKRRKFYPVVIGAVFAFIFALLLMEDSMALITSLFNKDAQNSISGSNISMRLSQLAACLALLQEHPVFGWGYGFVSTITGSVYYWQLRGLESIWFVTMTYYGIFGLIAEGMLAYFSLVIIPRKYNSRPLFFFTLAYWLTFTITTFPGILTHMYYLILFYMIKQSEVYKNSSILQYVKQRRLHIRL